MFSVINLKFDSSTIGIGGICGGILLGCFLLITSPVISGENIDTNMQYYRNKIVAFNSVLSR